MSTFSPGVQQGINALRLELGAWKKSLVQVSARHGEEAAFVLSLPPDFTSTARELRISLTNRFPVAPPVLVVSPSPWLHWPHSDKKGQLCLFGVGNQPSVGSPAQVISDTIRQFKRLLNLVMPWAEERDRLQEIEQEIVSYWNFQLPPLEAGQALLLTRPKDSCPLFALTVPRQQVKISFQKWFSNDLEALKIFYQNIAARPVTIRSPLPLGFYLRLNAIPGVKLPEPSAICDWIAPHISEDGQEQLDTWLREVASIPEKWLFLDIPGVSPVQVAGIWVGPKQLKGDFYAGLRGKKKAAIQNYPPGQYRLSLKKISTHMMTYDAVHARDTLTMQYPLQDKNVLLVGLGSLGSFIAHLLVKAGVGNLIFVDPETLVDANIGRHVLGMDALGQSKAHALKDFFLQNTPGVKITPIRNYVEYVYDSRGLSRVDAVIVSAADWGAESFLWEKKAQGAAWSLIQAWAEPFVEVGHALYAPNGEAVDGRPLFTPNGSFVRPYTTWPNNGIIPLPACGEGFISGGPISLNAVASMVANITTRSLNGTAPAMPRWYSWIGDVGKIAQARGEYKGPSIDGGCLQTVQEQDWPQP